MSYYAQTYQTQHNMHVADITAARLIVKQFGAALAKLSTFVYRNLWISVYNLCIRHLRSYMVDRMQKTSAFIHMLSTKTVAMQSSAKYGEKENA